MIFRALFVTVLIVLLNTGILFAQDDDVIKVDSDLVVLNATITDASGTFVSGLRKDQFKVLEDGKEQKISVFETESTPFAAVILVDTSGSMEQRVSLARSATINFLNGLRLDDVVSVYNFDSKVSLVQDFSNSRDIAERAYDLKARGLTVLNDAIYQAAQDLAKREEKRRAIIVLSDGRDTNSRYSAEKALRAASDANAIIYTVDMSDINTAGAERTQNKGVLKNFAEKSGGRFIEAQGGNEMRKAFKDIVNELGVQYTLGYEPAQSAKDGKWHSLEVIVAKPNVRIRTRQGFQSSKKQN